MLDLVPIVHEPEVDVLDLLRLLPHIHNARRVNRTTLQKPSGLAAAFAAVRRGDLTMPDYVWYEREIAPNVARLTVAAIQRAIGLAAPAARKVRDGIQIPRPHLWSALQQAIEGFGVTRTDKA